MHLVNYQHSTYIISEKIRQVIMLVVLGDTEGATLFCGNRSCWRCVFCDSYCTYCRQDTEEGGEGVVEEAGMKRHQSVQCQRLWGDQVEVVQPLIRDDSHVSQ